MKVTKKKLVTYLKDKGVYDEVDEILITELLYNVELCDELKADIAARGAVVAINTAGTLFNVNPSLNAYQSAAKQIMTICRKLGIDARSRIELKLNIDTVDDGFDD